MFFKQAGLFCSLLFTTHFAFADPDTSPQGQGNGHGNGQSSG